MISIDPAWAAFSEKKRWMTNRDVPLKHRLHLFDVCVRPVALFAMHTLPLGSRHLSRIAAVERKMKRLIVGWRRVDGEDWADTMRRMRGKIERADELHKTLPWIEEISKQQWRHAAHLATSKCSWPRALTRWTPSGTRSRGHPRLRWDDPINEFCRSKLHLRDWLELTPTQFV